MIEYLYDAIRADAGETVIVQAEITDEEGVAITSGCGLVLEDDDNILCMIDGWFDDEGQHWNFTIPANVTEGLSGRYWYAIWRNDNTLCFRKPFYLQ